MTDPGVPAVTAASAGRGGGGSGRRPGAIRSLTQRRPARREHQDRPLQLGVRAAERRRVRAAHRGHRPDPGHRRIHRRGDRDAALARARLGRRAGRGRPLRSLPAERADGPVRGLGAPVPRRGPGLLLLLHARGTGAAPGGGAQRGRPVRVRRALPDADRRPGRGLRGRGTPARGAIPHAGRIDDLHRPDPR